VDSILPPANDPLGALLQKAMEAAMQGRLPDAENFYRQAQAMAPRHPAVLIGFGHTLRHMQRAADAKALFAAAVEYHPGLADAHHGLGLACQDMGDAAGAEAAYRAALARDPRALLAMVSLAGLYTMTDRPDQALALLEHERSLDPMTEGLIEQARGTARMAQEKNHEALAHFDRVLALQPGNPQVSHARAGALQGLGREEEALAVLRETVRAQPGNIAAHHDLNQLLYRTGRDAEFLRSYDEADAQFPGTPFFLLAKAALLVRTGRPAEALEHYQRAFALAPGETAVPQGMAMAQLQLGQVDEAIASYERGLQRAPHDVNLLSSIAVAYLTARDPRKAEAAATKALQLAPTDQNALSALGIAWRLMDDEREWDLNRYDDFIQVFDLEPPPGFRSMADFCGELDQWLNSQHRDQREHMDQSLRRGTQTLGSLFRPGRHALVDALRLQIEDAVRRYIDGLPREERHPFLGRRGRGFAFAGSWSSRLSDAGYHINHVHPVGWISSAFYVALPETMQSGAGQEGWIKFGEPSYDAGLKEPVRRTVQPKVGRLVLFPSYMWHGTIPFHAPQNRTTVAFDVVPVG
jgi:tetratricopeptide (TPR) repeat protein